MVGTMYSRAREAMCPARLPASATMARARSMTITSCGELWAETRTAPSGKASRSFSVRTMNTGPAPTPGQAVSPPSISTGNPATGGLLPPPFAHGLDLDPQRTGLQNHQAAVLGQGPFHVLRHPEMRLQAQPPAGQKPGLVLGETRAGALVRVDRDFRHVPFGWACKAEPSWPSPPSLPAAAPPPCRKRSCPGPPPRLRHRGPAPRPP